MSGKWTAEQHANFAKTLARKRRLAAKANGELLVAPAGRKSRMRKISLQQIAPNLFLLAIKE